jgi:hypothetical protein
MYNWLTIRKQPRTEGPNYPTRAAQTVDAVVAKWIPVTAGLLSCFVTPTRAKLDSRYYESPNYPVRAAQTVDVTVRTWIPAFDNELAQTRTTDRPPLDVRRYDWSPEFVSIPRLVDPTIAKWEPAFSTELASYVTPTRPSLDVRRFDWDPPESGWIKGILTTPATVAQTWPAFQQSALSARTPDGSRLDVRSFDWFPQFVSIPRLTDPTVAAWTPAFGDESSSAPARAALDVRQYDWSAGFVGTAALTQTPDNGGSNQATSTGSVGWYVRRVYERTTGPQPVYTATLPVATPPTVAQTAPGWAFDGDLTRSRATLDVRAYDWLADESSWIKATLSTAPTVAQTAPAWTNQGTNFRTLSAKPLDLFRAQSIPDIFGVPDDWITWVPIQDDGSGRTAERARLDVRAYDWTQPAWIFKALPVTAATVPQQVGIWTDDGGRTGDRARLDVRSYEWAPTFSLAPILDPSIAKLAPIFSSELAGFRTPDDPRLDVRAFAWSPDAAGWILASFAPPVTTAQILPALIEGLGLQYRTGERGKLDVRLYDWTNGAGWAAPYIPVPVTVAQTWPAILGNLGTQFQTPARARLDVRAYDWQPVFTWPTRVVDATVAKWIPVFDAQWSPMTRQRALLDVRPLTENNGVGWLGGLQLVGVLPFPLTTTAVNEAIYTLAYLGEIYTVEDL